MRKIKTYLIIAAAIVGLMLALLILAPSFIDINRYRPEITDIISKRLNRSVTIKDIRLSFITGLSVIGSSVTIADPRNPDRPFVSVPEIKVTCAVLPLAFVFVTTLYAGWLNITGNYLPKHAYLNVALTAAMMVMAVLITLLAAQAAQRVLRDRAAGLAVAAAATAASERAARRR